MQARVSKWSHRRRCEDQYVRPYKPASFVKAGWKWQEDRATRLMRDDPFDNEHPALERLFEHSKYIFEAGEPGEYAEATLNRARNYLRKLALLADLTSRELPLPRILPAGESSVDLLWKTRLRGLLVNVPAGSDALTFFYKKDPLEVSGVLHTDEPSEELVRWLVD